MKHNYYTEFRNTIDDTKLNIQTKLDTNNAIIEELKAKVEETQKEMDAALTKKDYIKYAKCKSELDAMNTIIAETEKANEALTIDNEISLGDAKKFIQEINNAMINSFIDFAEDNKEVLEELAKGIEDFKEDYTKLLALRTEYIHLFDRANANQLEVLANFTTAQPFARFFIEVDKARNYSDNHKKIK